MLSSSFTKGRLRQVRLRLCNIRIYRETKKSPVLPIFWGDTKYLMIKHQHFFVFLTALDYSAQSYFRILLCWQLNPIPPYLRHGFRSESEDVEANRVKRYDLLKLVYKVLSPHFILNILCNVCYWPAAAFCVGLCCVVLSRCHSTAHSHTWWLWPKRLSLLISWLVVDIKSILLHFWNLHNKIAIRA